MALGIGCSKEVELKEKLLLVLSFGLFQAIYSAIGGLFGGFISNNFFSISGHLSGGIIILLGLLLLKEGFQNREECVVFNLTVFSFVVLGTSVSIDALGIGFSILFEYSLYTILINSIIIGIISSAMTILAFFVVKKIKKIALVEKYSDYMGGIILVLLGFRIVLGG